MAAPKTIFVKETISELKRFIKHSPSLIIPRLRMLIELKKCSNKGISKRELATLVGVNHNSIQTWRSAYFKGGIEELIQYKKNSGRPKILTAKEHKAIEKKLHDPQNGLRGYIELLNWIENEFKKTMKYNTLLKYANREFGASVKVARKSHVKKDEQKVETFKKTSVKSAKTPLKKEPKHSRR